MNQPLNNKMLVALDGSEAALRAVHHVANVACGCRGFELTLLHVVGIPPSVLHHEGSEVASTMPRPEQELEEKTHAWLEREKQRAEREVFAPAKEALRSGTAAEGKPRIQIKELAEAHPDVASAILEEARRGNYGIVVLDRRGRSYLKEFMFGSVTWKVIHHLQGRTVWVVG